MAFDYNKGFEYFDLNMSAISIAGHGKHIALAANREDEITMSGYVILEFNPLINLYNFSPVHNYGDFITTCIALTEDRMWTVSGHSDGEAIVYSFHGKGYAQRQTLSSDYPVVSLSLTDDHMHLVVGYEGPEVVIYHHTDELFTVHQTITFNSSVPRKVQLSKDHQRLLLTES